MAGNIEKEKKIKLTVDNTPPNTRLIMSDELYKELYTNTGTIYSLKSKDNLSGVKEIRYRIVQLNETEDIPIFNIYSESFKLDEGRYAIEYFGIDKLGNREEIKEQKIYVDNTAPESKINLEEKSEGENVKVILNKTIKIEAKDIESNGVFSGIKEIEYKVERIDSKAGFIKTEYKSNDLVKIKIKTAGVYRIRYYAIDNVGNKEAEKSINIKVE